jgi:hypothetical protein
MALPDKLVIPMQWTMGVRDIVNANNCSGVNMANNAWWYWRNSRPVTKEINPPTAKQTQKEEFVVECLR